MLVARMDLLVVWSIQERRRKEGIKKKKRTLVAHQGPRDCQCDAQLVQLYATSIIVHWQPFLLDKIFLYSMVSACYLYGCVYQIWYEAY